MKILLVTCCFKSNAGGAEVSTEQLLNALTNLGHEVNIATTRTPAFPSKGIIVLDFLSVIPQKILVPGNLLTDCILSVSLKRLYDKFKPDIIHVEDPFVLRAAVLANQQYKVPLIVTCHQSLLNSSVTDGSLHRKLVSKLFRDRAITYIKYLGYANAVISVSDFIKKDLIAKGLPSSKIQTIYNAVPDTSIRDLPYDKQEAVTPVTIVASGRLIKEKGFDIAIRAIVHVSREIPSIKLIIAGDGPEMSTLRSLVDSLNLNAVVEFAGWISKDRMNQLLYTADLVLMPSVYPEACPMILIEAMAFSKPVVATSIGGIPELIVNGENGYLVPSTDQVATANALLLLIRDSSLRKRMGKANKEKILEQFSSEKNASMTLKLYTQLLKPNN